jgi:hypothetical protein
MIGLYLLYYIFNPHQEGSQVDRQILRFLIYYRLMGLHVRLPWSVNLVRGVDGRN